MALGIELLACDDGAVLIGGDATALLEASRLWLWSR